jgi:hypothetical protein
MTNPSPKRDWRSTVGATIQALAVITALISAGLWFQSANIATPTQFRIHVNPGSNPGDTGLAVRSSDLTELGNKLAEQSKLNGYAAIFVAISVLLELVYMLLMRRRRT